jgi:hypothetical protein
MRRWFALSRWLLTVAFVPLVGGCAGMGQTASTTNPIYVRANNDEYVWERTVDVVHDYLFEIERENRLDGLIETRYKTGSGLLEPWHGDSPTLSSRTESTLQSIRRKAYIRIAPSQGGYMVAVEAFKELEDVTGAANFAGGATFLENNPLQRDLTAVVGQPAPSGWIPKGRDAELEQALLSSIRTAFGEAAGQ